MAMHANENLIHSFYTCFQQLDANGMIACYAPDIVFSDPVFPRLEGSDAGSMWQMLSSRAREFRLTFRDIEADEARGSAHWEATYLFSKTGRMVTNIIDAEFEFRDGLIVRHTDRFDFWRWSRQALGLPGVLLGWTPLVRNAVRGEARKGLDQFIASRK
jgi:ketosteroid isomerase-like protein